MKYITTLTALLFLGFSLSNCSIPKKTATPISYTSIDEVNEQARILVNFHNGPSFNYPTYVLWQEDLAGNVEKTLFITKAYASGIFGHQMVGDSIWLKTSGASYQPAALPYWTLKKGAIGSGNSIPTPEKPFLDGYTGATPLGDFSLTTSLEKKFPVRIFLEVNQPWDWNEFWTNNKYPDNPAYKHSAQPSLIYAVTIDKNEGTYFMNPVGYGDPKGQTGTLFTDLRSITTAKNIFESIEIQIIK